MQTESNKILSQIIVHSKYARFLADKGRRETWGEIVDRNIAMHVEKYPELEEPIKKVFNEYVKTKKVLPSMRAAQFAGPPIDRSPNRIFNCAYMPAEDIRFFSELMFLLLGGSGVGYSVQHRHVNKLPIVVGPNMEGRPRRYIIGDSIEGWSDAVKLLVESFFEGKRRIRFDFRDIRDKGELLVTSGGKAPGPDPLRVCLIQIGAILHSAVARRLKPIEVHDIACHIAHAVLAGGIRRASLISLFDMDDNEMLTCKSENWWEENAQRSLSNNSVMLLRGLVTKDQFDYLWERIEINGSGEPGLYWTNNLDWGTNPCCEIALRPYQFCNLTTTNVSDIETQEELNKRVNAAAFIGTLQAGYTDFHYLRPEWQEVTEEEALIGVSLTGIASNKLKNLDIKLATDYVIVTNRSTAALIGIKPSARCTTIKPEGTGSLVLGCSSGVHAWHAPYYIRRLRLGKSEALCSYLTKKMPKLVEDNYFDPGSQSIISIPQEAPKGAIMRDELTIYFLNRVMYLNDYWVAGGHVSGDNRNNVSCTVSIKEGEWNEVKQYLWSHRNSYSGIAILPYDGGSYKQAPFEQITKKEFTQLQIELKSINLARVRESEDNTTLQSEVACSGGICEIV